jgi:hypothetical protein
VWTNIPTYREATRVVADSEPVGELQSKWKSMALKRAGLVVRKRPRENPWSCVKSVGACDNEKG